MNDVRLFWGRAVGQQIGFEIVKIVCINKRVITEQPAVPDLFDVGKEIILVTVLQSTMRLA
jgi:hypothetical protein